MAQNYGSLIGELVSALQSNLSQYAPQRMNVAPPTLKTASAVDQLLGTNFNRSRQSILDELTSVINAAYAASMNEQTDNERAYIQALANVSDSAVDTMRSQYATDAAAGANRGMQAANALSAILGMQGNSITGVNDLFGNRSTLVNQKATDLAQAGNDATDLYTTLQQYLADFSKSLYETDSTIYTTELASWNAYIDAIMGALPYLGAYDFGGYGGYYEEPVYNNAGMYAYNGAGAPTGVSDTAKAIAAQKQEEAYWAARNKAADNVAAYEAARKAEQMRVKQASPSVGTAYDALVGIAGVDPIAQRNLANNRTALSYPNGIPKVVPSANIDWESLAFTTPYFLSGGEDEDDKKFTGSQYAAEQATKAKLAGMKKASAQQRTKKVPTYKPVGSNAENAAAAAKAAANMTARSTAQELAKQSNAAQIAQQKQLAEAQAALAAQQQALREQAAKNKAAANAAASSVKPASSSSSSSAKPSSSSSSNNTAYKGSNYSNTQASKAQSNATQNAIKAGNSQAAAKNAAAAQTKAGVTDAKAIAAAAQQAAEQAAKNKAAANAAKYKKK